VAQGFGLLLGTVCMNPKTAQTIASIVVLAFTLVGGYFVRGESLALISFCWHMELGRTFWNSPLA
jgi:hypothetical protein